MPTEDTPIRPGQIWQSKRNGTKVIVKGVECYMTNPPRPTNVRYQVTVGNEVMTVDCTLEQFRESFFLQDGTDVD